jgi:hypothetical protein
MSPATSVRLPYVKDDHRNTLTASLTEDEILQHLANVGYGGSVESVVFAIELGFAFHTSELDVTCFLTHY